MLPATTLNVAASPAATVCPAGGVTITGASRYSTHTSSSHPSPAVLPLATDPISSVSIVASAAPKIVRPKIPST
ncbi:MAG: hypothetical protein BWX68_02928 [Verrucomicrobia bacterium ADurb.Bin063]|nr:MAG: hypothetical protein BWX68_02928 [Verrucomicrobia bacterium ADurb.Bin063]